MMAFIGSLPIWLFCALCFASFVLLTFVFFKLKPYVIPRAGHIESSVLALSTISLTAGGFYAILFGLVAVHCWDNFNKIQENVAIEANSLATLYFDSLVFPEPVRMQIQSNVREYVLNVRYVEWKTITEEGNSSSHAWQAIWNIFSTLEKYNPKTTAETAIYSNMVSTLQAALESRRIRFTAMDNYIPSLVFLILTAGAVLIIFTNAMMSLMSGHRFIIFNIAIDFVLAFYLTLIVDLSSPYHTGQFLISPAPFYQGILSRIS